MRPRTAQLWVGHAQPQGPRVKELNSAGTKLDLSAPRHSLPLVTSQLTTYGKNFFFFFMSLDKDR